jgi:hypothetical protein
VVALTSTSTRRVTHLDHEAELDALMGDVDGQAERLAAGLRHRRLELGEVAHLREKKKKKK